jgi:transcriptional regulator with XRE-family HTH domain
MLAIRAIRVARGLTQSTVATRARIGRSYLSRIERGQFEPSTVVCRRLAEILELDEDMLFDDLEVGAVVS